MHSVQFKTHLVQTVTSHIKSVLIWKPTSNTSKFQLTLQVLCQCNTEWQFGTELKMELIVMMFWTIESLEVFLNAFAKGLAKFLPKTLCDGIMNKDINK